MKRQAIEEQVTDELPIQQKTVELRKEHPADRKRSRFWRELSGALAAGVVLLAATVLVLQVIAWLNGMPGLGVAVLIGHLVTAAVAIFAQRVVDRRRGRPALAAGLGIGAVVLAMLLLFWWS